jgi:hypothetical protein
MGENMKSDRVVKTLGLVVGLILLGVGCAGTAFPDTGLQVLARDASVGIELAFDAIPPETSRIFVHLAEADTGKNLIPCFANLRGKTLEEVKRSGVLSCPFAQPGKTYTVSVYHENGGETAWTLTEASAASGIYARNESVLALNAAGTGVIFSVLPEFSDRVQYAELKYNYCLNISIDDTRSIGYGSPTDALSYDFLSASRDDFKKSDILQEGSYPAYVTVFCKLIHTSGTAVVEWYVGAAQTAEFTYTL